VVFNYFCKVKPMLRCQWKIFVVLLSDDESSHSPLNISHGVVDGSTCTIACIPIHSGYKARMPDTKSMTKHSFTGVANPWAPTGLRGRRLQACR